MCLPLKPFKIEREWEHAGLKCVVVMAREAGHRCGYVRVPPSHPMFGKSYNDPEVDVHGGLTFAALEPCTHEDGSGWWFGFDCAHLGDLSTDPDVDTSSLSEEAKRRVEIDRELRLGDYSSFGDYSSYRSQAYVEREAESLAEQLAAVCTSREVAC